MPKFKVGDIVGYPDTDWGCADYFDMLIVGETDTEFFCIHAQVMDIVSAHEKSWIENTRIKVS